MAEPNYSEHHEAIQGEQDASNDQETRQCSSSSGEKEYQTERSHPYDLDDADKQKGTHGGILESPLPCRSPRAA